jgi:hypothetical protein
MQVVSTERWDTAVEVCKEHGFALLLLLCAWAFLRQRM